MLPGHQLTSTVAIQVRKRRRMRLGPGVIDEVFHPSALSRGVPLCSYQNIPYSCPKAGDQIRHSITVHVQRMDEAGGAQVKLRVEEPLGVSRVGRRLQRFKAKGNVAPSRLLCRRLETFHSPLPLFLRAPATGHYSQTGTQGSADQACSQFGASIEALLQELYTACAGRRLGTDQIRGAGQHAAGRALQVELVQDRPDRRGGRPAPPGRRKVRCRQIPHARMRLNRVSCAGPTLVVQTMVLTPNFILGDPPSPMKGRIVGTALENIPGLSVFLGEQLVRLRVIWKSLLVPVPAQLAPQLESDVA